MADETLSDITDALAQTFGPQIVRTWNRTGRLAQMVPVKSGGGQGGGKNLAWDVELDDASAGNFDEGADLDPGELDFDRVLPAVLPWGQYRAAFQLSNLEINAARANIGNAGALEDIFGERVLGKAAKLLSIINADMYTGTGTGTGSSPNIVGLVTALAATGYYATIDKGTYTSFAGIVSANGGTPRALTRALLSAAEAAGFVASNFSPTALLTTAGIATKYEGLFQEVQRIMSDGGGVPSVDLSTKQLFWRGAPIVRDRQAPTGDVLMVDVGELALHVLDFAPAADGVQTQTRPLPSSNGAEIANTSIPVHICPLARMGSGQRFMLEIYAQLKVPKPSGHVLIKDISET